MHCDHQIISNHLIDYLDNKVSPAVHKQIEQALSQCETCQSTYHQAIELSQVSHQWTNQSVPEWHRTEFAVRPRQKNSSWLSWSALATSSFAMLMVVFQVQFSSNESGFNITFGNQTDSQVEKLVEQKINQYKKEQALLLDAKLLALSTQQANNNKLLAADILEKSRDERRDDLNFLVTGIQTQRFEDQQKVEKRLAYLADNQIQNNQFINNLIENKQYSKGGKK